MSGYSSPGDITITVERLTPAPSGPTGLGLLDGLAVVTIGMDPVTQQIQQAVTKVLTDMLEDLVVKTICPEEIFGVRISAERLHKLSGAQIVDFLDGIEQALKGQISVTVSPLDAFDAVRKTLSSSLGATAQSRTGHNPSRRNPAQISRMSRPMRADGKAPAPKAPLKPSEKLLAALRRSSEKGRDETRGR
ncbi:hypothetical protein [Cryobacterium zhongshanensis]|uniref:Uncharacterized protein n=1 Tax=Cryobacterium zhongshanensis TaxID=2928153 RepID=A0AA41QXP7_9MICO|nr:hypothetical protein [Cryobacterium zhongshanensis]MCI4659576.1 hypothetical protein [Cryobacterium zhongshanensis]